MQKWTSKMGWHGGSSLDWPEDCGESVVFVWGRRLKSSILWSHALSSMPQGRGHDGKNIQRSLKLLSTGSLCARCETHRPCQKAYETLGMLPLRVVLTKRTLAWSARVVNMDVIRMPRSIKFSQMVKGKRPRGRPFMRWSDTLKLPGSGKWLEEIRAEDWRVRISSLTDSLVLIFKETRNRTGWTDHEFLTNPNIVHGACYVECERSLCMYVCPCILLVDVIM